MYMLVPKSRTHRPVHIIDIRKIQSLIVMYLSHLKCVDYGSWCWFENDTLETRSLEHLYLDIEPLSK
jgi:hypothetical protein